MEKTGGMVFEINDEDGIKSVTIVSLKGKSVRSYIGELSADKKSATFTVWPQRPGFFAVRVKDSKDNISERKVLAQRVIAGRKGAFALVFRIDKLLKDEEFNTLWDEIKANAKKNNIEVVGGSIGRDFEKKKSDVRIRGRLIERENPGLAWSFVDPPEEVFLLVGEVCVRLEGSLLCPPMLEVEELPAPTGLAQFDANHNSVIDTPEFFDILDAWIAKEIDDETFFQGLDLWISGEPISGAPPPSSPPTPCFLDSEVIALWRGNPIIGVLQVEGLTPIGVAFNQPITLPQGTSLQLNVSSTNPGLEVGEGQWRSPFQGQFSQVSPTSLLGIGSLLLDVDLPARKELAQVTLQPTPEAPQPGAQILIQLQVTLPNCPSIQFQTTVNLNIRQPMPRPPEPPPEEFTLTVTVVGEGGSVVSDPPGIECLAGGVGVCYQSYPAGTTVILTAILESGWVLSGWEGCDSTSKETCTVTVNGIKSVSAAFVLQIPIGEGLLVEEIVVMKGVAGGIAFSSKFGVPIQLEVFDLSGRSVFFSPWAKRVILNTTVLGRPLANGVYLYLIRVHVVYGQLITSQAKKLVIQR
jgi:hypothetical protein